MNRKAKPNIKIIFILFLIFSSLLCVPNIASQSVAKNPVPTVDIAKDAIKITQVYIGPFSGENLKPKCVRMLDIIKRTKEYAEIEKIKGEKRGTAKYWIALSQASDDALSALRKYAEKNDINFLAEREAFLLYLKLLDEFKDVPDEELIETFDITQKIIDEYYSESPKKSKTP